MGIVLALVGAPGCGKSTLAEKIAEEFGFFYLDMGTKMRESNRFKEVGSSDLVPDQAVIAFLFELLPHNLPEKIIISGFPRSVGQATWLKNHFFANQYGVIGVELVVPDEVAILRSGGRAKKVQENGAGMRLDDQPKVIKARVKRYTEEYGQQTYLCMQRHFNCVWKIDGTQKQGTVLEIATKFVQEKLVAFGLTHNLIEA